MECWRVCNMNCHRQRPLKQGRGLYLSSCHTPRICTLLAAHLISSIWRRLRRASTVTVFFVVANGIYILYFGAVGQRCIIYGEFQSSSKKQSCAKVSNSVQDSPKTKSAENCCSNKDWHGWKSGLGLIWHAWWSLLLELLDDWLISWVHWTGQC